MNCLKCGYRWSNRVRNPARCPNCGNPDYQEPRRTRYGRGRWTYVSM